MENQNKLDQTLELNTSRDLDTNRELYKTINNIKKENDTTSLEEKIMAAINNSQKAIQLYHNIAIKTNELEAILAKLLKAHNNKINDEDNDSWAIESINKTNPNVFKEHL